VHRFIAFRDLITNPKFLESRGVLNEQARRADQVLLSDFHGSRGPHVSRDHAGTANRRPC
jgi:hypothetical protein